MVAEVIIASNVKTLNRIFDYQIPETMEVKIGSRIWVPFGKGKHIEEGYIIGIKEKSEYQIKEIKKVIDTEALTEENIKLAKWMAKKYFCNIADAIKLMLMPGTTTKKIENRMKDKVQQCVFLKKEGEEIDFEIETGKLKSDKQIRILQFLKENEGICATDLEIYTDTSRAILKTLEKNGYIEIIEKVINRNPFLHKDIKRDKKLILNTEQRQAYEKVEDSIEEKRYEEFLIYGITGSGKTEIYLQLIEKVINQGKSAIILVPEISLTPQMVDRFIARFGKDCIAVLHSRLSLGERHDSWKKIKEGSCRIVIRSKICYFCTSY